VGLKAGETYVSKSGGLTATTDIGAHDVSPHDFDAVPSLAGGRRTSCVAIPRGKVVGSICHARSVLISAAIMCGRRTTGTLGIKDDLVSAGATWVDKRAFRDGHIVWGWVVADIPACCHELVAALS